MKFDQEMYRYAGFMLRCDICYQHYPIWMVPDDDWKAGLKSIRKVFKGLIRNNAKNCICKPCWEHFNGPTRYLSLETYLSLYYGADCSKEGLEKFEKEGYRAALEEIWNAPSEYSEEKHANELKETIDCFTMPRGN